MSIIQAIILGVFQGIAEFLPISSSGHLVILQNLFNIQEGELFFTVMLHFGTLLSIIIVYFRDITKMIIGFIKVVLDFIAGKGFKLDNQYKVLPVMVIVGTIPTALIGIVFEDFFEGLYQSLTAVGIALIVTGVLLWISEKYNSDKKGLNNITFFDAIIIGTFQGLAIVPGVSRSGSTIVGGLFRGLNKEASTKFSFFIALPAIAGASLLQLLKVFSSDNPIGITSPLIIGVVLSTITGVFAIKILINMLKKGKLHYFSYYLWILGAIIITSKFFA